jgi:LuxR family maltose regulon positive regulatory protein
MGYGKTTSVRNYLDNREIRMIWVSLSGSDGDDLIFWHKLCSSTKRIYPEIGTQLMDMGFPQDAGQLSDVMDYIWNFSDSIPKVIVIDDYHLINQSKQVATLIEVITEEEIPNLHIVLISRTRPQFNYMNLLAKGLCNYLNTELLAFNKQEIKEYLYLTGYTATEEEIKTLYRYTNGWIAAIYLLALGLKQGIPVTEASYITKLVEKNLFSSFPDTTKQILLKLSLLDSFSVPQAVQILEDSQVSDIIEQLMEQNAFILYDRQTGIYQLHNVLLEFLREKFISEAEKKHVCHCAGGWYFEQEDYVRAIDYYHRAGKIEELLEQMNQKKNMRSGFLGVELLYQVFTEIPAGWYVKYPYPLLHFALCFTLSRDKRMMEESSRILALLEEHFKKEENTSSNQCNCILGEIEIVKIFHVFNDAQEMVEYSKNADQLLLGEASCTVFRDDAFTFGVPHFLYSYYCEVGKLKETVACLKEGFPPRVFNGCGTGCDLVALAEYALETGDLKRAYILAEQATYRAEAADQVCIMICADFAKMRFYLATGEIKKAKELLLTARKYLTDPKYQVNPQSKVIYHAALDMCEGYLYGCLKQIELIPEWLRTKEMPARILMMRGLAFQYIIYGNVIALEQNWARLEILCERFMEEYNIFHNQLGFLHNSIYEASAKYHLYGMKAGLDTLLPVLKETWQDGIVLPFAEHYEYALPLLYELQKQNRFDAGYLEKVIKLCEQYRDHVKLHLSMDAILTEREIQVLKLLSRGMTQHEIAKSLCFSVSTAKKHLESIYRKLNVNNKISAVQKAQENKII